MAFITLTDEYGKPARVNVDNIISYSDSGFPKQKTSMLVKGRDKPLFFEESKEEIDKIIEENGL